MEPIALPSQLKKLLVPDSFCYVPYHETGYYSRLVTDYLANDLKAQALFQYNTDEDGIERAIADRALFPVDRMLLAEVLEHQYATTVKHPKVVENLSLLRDEATYTVCTAHQPNLMTGYLYFVYKIMHAIKLAHYLNEKHTDKHFVPVYYMGSEDNDLDELGVFHFRGDTYRWDANGQQGAVGRMSTDGLKPLLTAFFKYFGPPGEDQKRLQAIITNAYLGHPTIAAATQYLVNELFGEFGLIVIDPDERRLKAAFIPVMERELLAMESRPIVDSRIAEMEQYYKIQAHPRDINLFYLNGQIRERIELQNNEYVVLNTEIRFTPDEMIRELHEYPERFSPNVVLRGLFQETILPNISFIGGGAEVAYWLQLLPLFQHFGVYYPPVLLRQSIAYMDHTAVHLQQLLGLSDIELFRSEDNILRRLASDNGGRNLDTLPERAELKHVIEVLKQKSIAIDPTLAQAAEAVLSKINDRVDALEKKMYRAEKRKLGVQTERIQKLRQKLMPNNHLQEREENFVDFYLLRGSSLFHTIFAAVVPFRYEFIILKQEEIKE